MARSSRKRNYHVGGTQQPLFLPDSDWVAPQSLPDLRQHKRVGLDRECRDDGLAHGRGPGWAYGAGHVCGVSYAWRDEDGRVVSDYFPIEHPDTPNCFSRDQIRRWEEDHQKAGVIFAMQNAPYDVGWGYRDLGVRVPSRVDDATCMAYVVDENRLSYDLNSLCAWRGLPGKDEMLLREAAATYGFDPKTDLHRMPARYAATYAAADAARALELADGFDPEIDAQDVRAAYQLEMDLLPMVHEMRRRGIRVDLDAADRAKIRLTESAEQALTELSRRCGERVTISELRSNSWLERRFTEEQVRFPREGGDFGRGSFEAKWMKNVDHWLPRLVVRAKSRWDAAEKFIGTYVEGFAHLGRLHASINQFRSEDGGTRTYRFSYSDPPLQQMPNRDDELATLIRGVFLPEDGEWWEADDYSQQEYRLIVHYAELHDLRKSHEAGDRYRSDPRTDFHSMVAEMTGLDRKPAKDSNFAKSYGAGVPKFAAMINKSVAEAKAIMDQYDEMLPFNKDLNELCQKKAERTGFLRLLDGARVHFEDWEPRWLSREERAEGWRPGSPWRMNPCRLPEARERVETEGHPWYRKTLRRANCRKAMNSLIQGGAARQTKLAMRACWREGLVPLIQMHDELGFSVTEKTHGLAAEIMRNVVKLRVPMQVDAEFGVSWGAAKNDWRNRNDVKRLGDNS